MTTTLDLAADVIDVRDIIEAYEAVEASDHMEDAEERDQLAAILDDLKGNGGDEQWRGDWYPVTLVDDHYFTAYARDLLEDCEVIPRDLPPWVEIDWDATARNVQIDYTPTEINGRTYWYR